MIDVHALNEQHHTTWSRETGLMTGIEPMPDLAPPIHRQRLVVEGRCEGAIDAETISRYLRGLSTVCGMTVLLEPVTHRSDLYGWAGWIHWETSGAHFYAWETPLHFFSVDIYACKPFDPADVIEFTAELLNPWRIVAKEF